MQQQQWEQKLQVPSFLLLGRIHWSKTTTGLLSRSGIIPISSTLDTPGPMMKKMLLIVEFFFLL
jgi:hypothetical protein